MRYMLAFSLGPVQPFIAQARKTRDLWLGSYLLSKLMEAGMSKISTEALVFPTQKVVINDIPDLPNKYIALFDSPEEAKDAAQKSVADIKERWDKICLAVWDAVVKEHKTSDTESIWRRQTNFETLFEIYWVIVEKDPGESYHTWLARTQKTLDARKRLRDFRHPFDPQRSQEFGEPGEKSSISGEREVLHGKGTSQKSLREFWENIASHHSASVISKDGSERLDAIDTVKRFATEAGGYVRRKAFPSTSSIATASFVQRLLETQVDEAMLQAVKSWLDITNPLKTTTLLPLPYFAAGKKERNSILQRVLWRDGDAFFRETYTPERLKKDYDLTDERAKERDTLVKEGPSALTTLLRATDALTPPVPRPTPYYAIVQMDGDNMGILLSGVKDKEQHRNISGALSTFAREDVPPIVQEERPGFLVYAGGDDVLALSPLEGLLNLAERLQARYTERIVGQVAKEREQDVTASMGIAVAHHYTSLSYALRATREAERLAKDHYGRNALVLTILRRSGEQTRVGCHWSYPELPKSSPLSMFTRFYQFFQEDLLSPKCVHILLEEAPALVKLDKLAQASEIRRVFLRQRNKTDQEEEGRAAKLKDELATWAKTLADLAEAMDNDERRKHIPIESVELHSEKRRYGLVEVFGWLLAMAFFTRKGRPDAPVYRAD